MGENSFAYWRSRGVSVVGYVRAGGSGLKVYDMFSGIGGFSLGFQREGYTIKACAEIEDYPSKVYAKNFPEVINFGDVTKIDYELGQFDVIIGGFPCTDISIASTTRKGITGERSILWKEFFRAITRVRPKYCVIENVFMLLARGLEEVLYDLAQIGYDARWTTIDAKYTGIPQRRRRVYICGVRDGIPDDSSLLDFEKRSSEELREKILFVEKGFEWDFRTGEKKQDGFTFHTRQRSDEFQNLGVSSTLTKRDYKSFTDLVVDSEGVRRVDPIERLRLQGFPDCWHLVGATDSEMFKYNGMSVSSVQWIARELMKFDRSILHENV